MRHASSSASPLAPPLLAAAAAPKPAAPSGMRLSALAVLLAVLAVLIAWAAVAGMLRLKREDALDAEQRQNANLARVLAEQTLRVLSTADQATMRVRDAAVSGRFATQDLVRFASETGLAPQILVQLAFTDAAGRLAASNLDPDGSKSGHIDLSQREHIRVHLAPSTLPADQRPASPEGLFIGKPVLGKVSGKWTIQLSRRIVGADGALMGVVVASLDPTYFEDVYRRVALGSAGGVSLLGSDLGIRARVIGGQAVGMGTLLPATSPFVRLAKDRPEGHYITPSGIDGIERIIAFRRIADYPLYVLVLTGLDEALAEWQATLRAVLALTAALTVAVGVGIALFIIGLRRLERSNEALRASEAQAQAANQAKSEFLAAISHELRTPLTSIRGFAELMERRLEDARFREQAGLIRKGAEQLNELLSQILDLAKVEAGAMALSPQPVALRPLLQGVADYFGLAAQAKGLAMHVALDPALPGQAQLDALRVKQILNNLLSNAVKFTERGSVTLGAEVVGDELRMWVRDTGPGIAEAAHELIFERFRQGSADTSTQHGGTGLGLALSRGLAELMHGRLTLASRPGEGACFTLAIPLAPAPGLTAPTVAAGTR